MILFGRTPIFAFLLFIGIITYFTIPTKTQLGMIYFNSFQYEKALEYLSESESVAEGNVLVLKKIKDYFTLQGNIKKALEVMEKLYQLRPHNMEYLLEVETLADWNQLPEKKLYYQEIRADLIEDNIEKQKLKLQIAQGYRYLRNFKEADRMFGELGKSDNRIILENTINYYLTTKQAENAVKCIDRYKKKFGNQGYVAEKYDIYLYQSYTLLNQNEEALSQASKITGLSNNEAIIEDLEKLTPKQIKDKLYYIEGITFHALKLNKVELVRGIKELLAVKLPHENEILFELAEFYYSHVDKKLALKAYENVLKERDLNREELIGLSDRFYDLNEKAIAIIPLERLTKKFPKNRNYWRRLGELYEETGQKQKALDSFLILLKLEKGHSQGLFKHWFKSLDKFVMNAETTVIHKYKKMPKINPKISKLEDHIIYLLNDIGDVDQMIRVLKELLSDNPNSPALLSALGQAYYVSGDLSRSEETFDRVISLNTKDKMALEILIARDLREKKYDLASKKIEALENQKNVNQEPYYLSMKEEILFQSADSNHKNFCLSLLEIERKGSLEMGRLQSRCLNRLDRKIESADLKKQLLQENPKDLSLREEIFYEEMEQGNLESAKDQLDALILHGEEGKYLDLKIYFAEAISQRDKKNGWAISTDSYYLWTSNFSFLSPNLDVSKGVGDLRFGVNNRAYQLIDGGDNLFSYSEVYSSYEWRQGHQLRLSFGRVYGDKNLSSNMGLGYTYGDSNNYLNITYNTSLPGFQTLSLFQDRLSKENGLNLYSEHYFNEKLSSTFSIDYFKATVSDAKAQVTRLRLGIDYRIFPNSCLEVGTLVGYSALDRESELLNLGYLRKSVPYYALFKCNNQYLRTSTSQKWFYATELGLGGDSGREISFGNSNYARAELSYLFSLYNSVKLYGEHYTEALNASRGATSIVGMQIQFLSF